MGVEACPEAAAEGLPLTKISLEMLSETSEDARATQDRKYQSTVQWAETAKREEDDWTHVSDGRSFGSSL